MVALIFPGQGSQELGMGRQLAENFPAAKQVFEEVNDALSQDLTAVMWGEDAEALTATANTQPAIMAASIAALRAIESEVGAMSSWSNAPAVAAGHSLGEYSAHVAAGSFSLSTAAKLLRIRGNAMQAAVAPGQGAMAAILNLDADKLEAICQASIQGDGCCQIANDNAPGQIVISGDKASVDAAMAAASEAGAKRCVPLAVSAPFHCALMAPAQEEMAQALADAEIAAPNFPVIANFTAQAVSTSDQVIDTLVAQVTGRVRWVECMQAIVGMDQGAAAELGHGKVLAGLNKRIARDMKVLNVADAQGVGAFVEFLNA